MCKRISVQKYCTPLVETKPQGNGWIDNKSVEKIQTMWRRVLRYSKSWKMRLVKPSVKMSVFKDRHKHESLMKTCTFFPSLASADGDNWWWLPSLNLRPSPSAPKSYTSSQPWIGSNCHKNLQTSLQICLGQAKVLHLLDVSSKPSGLSKTMREGRAVDKSRPRAHATPQMLVVAVCPPCAPELGLHLDRHCVCIALSPASIPLNFQCTLVEGLNPYKRLLTKKRLLFAKKKRLLFAKKKPLFAEKKDPYLKKKRPLFLKLYKFNFWFFKYISKNNFWFFLSLNH